MSLSLRRTPLLRPGAARLLTSALVYGRSASYGRIHSPLQNGKYGTLAGEKSYSIAIRTITRPFLLTSGLDPVTLLKRSFASYPSLLRQTTQHPEDIRDPPRTNEEASAKTSGEKPDESKNSNNGKESKSGDSEQEGRAEDKQEKKQEAAPPPPHGDKSPWQVFRETLQSEFKQSKEWNESTKALASSANQFSESESVKRARSAFEKTSGAASSTASSALKSTGQVLGKSAAWTWETPVVKGVRKGANAVGSGLDKATKPLRETEAFKNVKDVIDDGSSSRYGGWVEKEERRKARELRELKETTSGKHRTEKAEEDPK